MSVSLMLKSARKEQEEKMMQLIPKMRRRECNVTEIWLLQEFMSRGGTLSDEIVKLLPADDDCGSHEDAWLRMWMVYARKIGGRLNRRRIEKILKPHEEDPLCATLLGRMYISCDHNQSDLAVSYYRRSADAGCAEGIYCLAHSGRNQEIYKLYIEAAEMMHPGAIVQHGKLYSHPYSGFGVDMKRAFQLYEQASSLGSPYATCLMAQLYSIGQGVARDLRRAASLHRQALLQGYNFAASFLLKMKREDPYACIPFGEWRPDPFMHQYVPNSMHRRMYTILLMHAQRGSLFSQLPRDILHLICFWLCTGPLNADERDKLTNYSSAKWFFS